MDHCNNYKFSCFSVEIDHELRRAEPADAYYGRKANLWRQMVQSKNLNWITKVKMMMLWRRTNWLSE